MKKVFFQMKAVLVSLFLVISLIFSPIVLGWSGGDESDGDVSWENGYTIYFDWPLSGEVKEKAYMPATPNQLITANNYTISSGKISGSSTPSYIIPIREGYHCTGVATKSAVENQTGANIDFSTFEGDGTSSYIWYLYWVLDNYSITYELDGGTNNSKNPSSYTIKDNDITLEEPTKDGFVFTGWTYDKQTTPVKKVTIPQGSQGNKKFTANWVSDYTVTFDTHGGSSIAQQSIAQSQTATRPKTEPTKTGYTFVDWYENINDANPFDFSTPINENKTLHAKWIETEYKISYDLDGGVNDKSNPSVYTIESADISLKAPTKTGFTFLGWTYEHNGSMTNPTIDIMIPKGSIGDWQFKAHWKENQTSYHVTFDTQGGTPIQSQNVKYGECAIEPSQPTKEGYHFSGWFENLNNNENFDFTTPITNAKILYAKWEQVNYKINYHLDNGINHLSNPTDYTISTPTFSFQKPTKEGYVFAGWTYKHESDEHDILTYDLSIKKGTVGDWDLYAHWIQDSNISQNKVVHFDTQGGSKVESQFVNVGNLVKQPENPIKEGYTFAGWYINESTIFDFSVPIQNDITLYAKWIKNSSSIIFEPSQNNSPSQDNLDSQKNIETEDIKVFPKTSDEVNLIMYIFICFGSIIVIMSYIKHRNHKV